MDQRRRLAFRRCLNSLANQLSRQNVDDMKFVCKDHVPVSRMERVRSALDIFQALEERGKLSIDDTSFLVKVLISIERSNLVTDLQRAGFAPEDALQINHPPPIPPAQGYPYPPQQQDQHQAQHEFLFNEMLLKIAQNLTGKNVESLTFTWAESVLGMSSDRISSATQLFQLLQQRQIVTQTNLQALYNELEVIGRSDLCKRINNYLEQTGQRPCQVPMDEDGYVGRRMEVATMAPGNTIRPTEETGSYHYGGPDHTHSANHGYQTNHLPSGGETMSYGTSEMGQPITSPADTTGSPGSMMAGPFRSTLPSTILPSYPTASTETSSLGAQRANSGEKDRQYTYQPCSYFVPREVYPVGPRSGVSVEETGGQDIPLQKEPLGLTFPPNEEEEGGVEELQSEKSQVEIQDLHAQWTQSQEQLAAKEMEKRQLCEDLEHLQEQNIRIMKEKEGENVEHQANTQELEAALQKKIKEVDSLRQEVKDYQQNLQRLPQQIPDMNPDELYALDKNPHGVCLIINNHRFYHDTDPTKAHPNRGGAEIDQYNLTQTFRYLRYRVEVKENLTSDQMTDCVMRVSQRDHSNYDSFICCILSHGEHDIIHGSNSEPVNINDLTGLMKLCSSLRNKPKLFFIQCCRGDDEEKGFEKDNPGDKDSNFRSTIPRDADFFLGYATPLGKAAYRSRKHGSWYISELCKVFTQYGYHSSLSTMMRRVNRQVSNAFTKDGYKQCTEFVDRLRKEVHFFHFIRNRTKAPQ